MRTVLTLAAILALSRGSLASEPQLPSQTQIPPAPQSEPSTASAYETTVHRLKHSRAHQVAPLIDEAVRSSVSLQSSGRPLFGLASPIAVIPTTSDDTLIVMCPRNQARLIEQMIEACDVPRQFAVKIQLFEITPDGKAVPAGEQNLHVLVGREGVARCKTLTNETIELSLKVDAVSALGDLKRSEPLCSAPQGRCTIGNTAGGACCQDSDIADTCCEESPSVKRSARHPASNGDEHELVHAAPGARAAFRHEHGTGKRTQDADRREQFPAATAAPRSAADDDGSAQIAYEPVSEAPAAVPNVDKTEGQERLFPIRKTVKPGAAHTGVKGNGLWDESTAIPQSLREGLRHLVAERQSSAARQTEPPALLSLPRAPGADSNPADDPGAALPRFEALKSYEGRRLSEIFEPRDGNTPPVTSLGRLLAEIPKPAHDRDAARGQSLIVVDLPDRVRIFEDRSPAAETPPQQCTSCNEECRTFLEQFFRNSDVAHVSHAQPERSHLSVPRVLPAMAHSKIETTAVTYPLHDLVLLDDEGHPVFDTCTFIDHLQTAVEPQSWSHPSVSVQLDQQSVSLVVRQTRDVHEKIASHLRYLRRLQIKQICNLIERMSVEADSATN